MRSFKVCLVFSLLLIWYNSIAQEITPELTAQITRSDCSGESGAIDLSVQCADNYIKLFGGTKITVDAFNLIGARSFTMEGRVRVKEDDSVFKSRDFISLFGQQNAVAFGFVKGKLAFSIETKDGNITYQEDAGDPTKNIYPNDGEWHHVAIRGDGEKVEMLIDGNIVGSYIGTYSELISVGGVLKDVAIGDGLWGVENEAFEGEISRLAFWAKFLDDTEFSNIDIVNIKRVSKETDGLILAYNIEETYGDKLIAETRSTTEDYDGIVVKGSLNRALVVKKYSWIGNGLSSDKQDISSLAPGRYQVNVEYEIDGVKKNVEKVFGVGFVNNLKVNIVSDKVDCCEGQEVKLITEIIGGVNDKTIYMWDIEDEFGVMSISGTSNLFVVPQLVMGKIFVSLRVITDLCGEAISEKTAIFVREKIKTGKIFNK